MKLAVNFSEALLSLLAKEPDLPVDYIKVPTMPFPGCFSQFDRGSFFRKLLPHPAQPGVLALGHPIDTERFNRNLITEVIDRTGPPYLSTHLEARVEYFPSFKEKQHLNDRGLKDALMERFLSGIDEVRKAVGLPLVIENFPYYSWWRHYKLGSDPSFIAEVCERGGCSFLLDIAHAKCSAWYFGIPVEEYLERLPLQELREVHLAGAKLRVEGMRDTHTMLTEDDYRLLDLVLAKTKPEIITIEYGGLPDQILNLNREYEPLLRNKPDELREMIFRMASILGVPV